MRSIVADVAVATAVQEFFFFLSLAFLKLQLDTTIEQSDSIFLSLSDSLSAASAIDKSKYLRKQRVKRKKTIHCSHSHQKQKQQQQRQHPSDSLCSHIGQTSSLCVPVLPFVASKRTIAQVSIVLVIRKFAMCSIVCECGIMSRLTSQRILLRVCLSIE